MKCRMWTGKKCVLISKEVWVTLLTDGYLSNGQKERRTCIAAICIREQIVDFITSSQRMQLYPPVRGFTVDGQISMQGKTLLVNVDSNVAVTV